MEREKRSLESEFLEVLGELQKPQPRDWGNQGLYAMKAESDNRARCTRLLQGIARQHESDPALCELIKLAQEGNTYAIEAVARWAARQVA